MTTRTHRRREATPEQKDATQKRRQIIRNSSKTIADMTDTDRLALARRLNILTCEGHPLSPFNCCLVASQQENATMVGGIRQ